MKLFRILVLSFLIIVGNGYFYPRAAQATVAEQTGRNDYTGNGATVAFSYGFKIFVSTEIEVLLDGVVQSSNYTVTGLGEASGGTVTFTTAPASGVKVTFLRKQPASQTSGYISNEAFPSGRVEKDLDKQAMINQMQAEQLARTPKLAKQSTYTNLSVPDPQAGKYLRWNDSLTGIENVELTKATVLNLVSGDIKNTDDYASFSAAITAIGSSTTTLVIPQAKTVSADTIVPANVTLWFIGSGALSVDINKTVTINGAILADLRQIFTGAGTIAIGKVVPKIYPHWWGADPTGVILANSAFAKAAAIREVIHLAGGTFKIEAWTQNTLTIFGELATIQGDGDLITSTNIRIDSVTFKNLTTLGKLLTIGATGSLKISESSFQKANYHIYMAAGFLVGSWITGTKFGGGSLATGAAIESRTYDGLNGYAETNVYTWFNNKGLSMKRGGAIELSNSVFEYHTAEDITINATASQSFDGPKFDSIWFEAPVTKALPFVLIDVGVGTSVEVQFYNSKFTAIAVNPVKLNSGNGEAYFFASGIDNATITSGTWKVRYDGARDSTWTPTLTFGGGSTGITYTEQAGVYTRVGNRVFFTGSISLSNKGSSTGIAAIGGLPFTSKNAVAGEASVSVRLNTVTYVGSPQVYVVRNSTSINFEKLSEAGVVTDLDNTNFANTSAVIVTGSYEAVAGQ